MPDSPAPAAGVHPPTEAPPGRAPGYRLERKIGEGAYGSVWLGVQERTGKQVAVKFFHRGTPDLELMRREVERLADLYSAREIVQLLDVGWDGQPPWFVMEFCERGSLDDLVRRGPLPVPEVVRFAREIATALAHAHGRGVLHCDLKPANVLLDAQMNARLADFGQSRRAGDEIAGLGTFFYMAPEQADLAAVPDARWDVYALGAILYTLLTGSPPYRDRDTRETLASATDLGSRLEAYRRLIRKSPRPAAHRGVAGMDRALADLLDRCLDPKPARRLPDVQSFLAGLDAREARRARRPLLIMGAVGPALLTGVMGFFALQGFQTAMHESTEAVLRSSLDACRFAAQFAAETAARELDRRWDVLEFAADDEDLRGRLGLQNLNASRPNMPAALGGFQEWLDRVSAEHPHLGAASWFLTDRNGTQLARVPRADTIGKNWRFRDYFHGRGTDFDRDSVPTGLEPIRRSHRSPVFRSNADGRRLVAFSSPVWSGKPGDRDRQVLGVLAVTMEVGRFAELRAGGSVETAVLADLREDSAKKRGLLLQHPRLEEHLRRREPLPDYRARERMLTKWEALRAAVRDAPDRVPPADLWADVDYRDPAEADPVRCIAAFEPVVTPRGRDTGWIVVIQAEYDRVVAPVEQLRSRLLWLGLTAVALAAGVLTGLWLLVMRLLSTSSGTLYDPRSGAWRSGRTSTVQSTGRSSGSGGAGTPISATDDDGSLRLSAAITPAPMPTTIIPAAVVADALARAGGIAGRKEAAAASAADAAKPDAPVPAASASAEGDATEVDPPPTSPWRTSATWLTSGSGSGKVTLQRPGGTGASTDSKGGAAGAGQPLPPVPDAATLVNPPKSDPRSGTATARVSLENTQATERHDPPAKG